MKSAEGVEAIVCTCPYCKKDLIFECHPIQYEVEPKATKETCYKCKKKFWLKSEG